MRGIAFDIAHLLAGSLVLAPWFVRVHDITVTESAGFHWVVEAARALFG